MEGGGGLTEVTLIGDATGVSNSGGTITVTLATVATAGTYTNISIDAKGRVVKAAALSGANVNTALGYTPANIANPAFTGTPTAPTPPTTDNSTRLATTAYVQSNIFKIVLNSSVTFYVSTTGCNSNNGSMANPFATVTHAYNLLQRNYNLNGYNATIQIEDGSYTENIVLAGIPEGYGTNNIFVVGNNGSPTNVTFNVVNGAAVSILNGATISLSGISMSSSNGGALFLQNNAAVSVGPVNFGSCPNGFHVQGGGTGSYITFNSPYTITGSAQSHYLSGGGSEIVLFTGATPITLSLSGGGTLNFPQGFAVALSGGNIDVFPGVTFTVAGGTTVNATKSVAKLNGVINTNGQGGDAYFPGNVTGTAQTGGQYA